MVRENMAFLLGTVSEEPKVQKNGDEYGWAMVRVTVVRGFRTVGDMRNYLKCDTPLIMTKDEELIKEIEKWKRYDVVSIKGVVSSKMIKKSSYCEHCGMKNVFYGALVYINPIFAEKLWHLENEEECLEYLSSHREISNQIFLFGTLCRDPGKVKSKYDYSITQYQVAMKRKYKIRTDPPEIKADFPWIKSYGENAEEDFKRLKVGAEVYVDGCLQTRSIMRRVYCGQDTDEKGHPKKDENGVPVFKKGPDGKTIGCGLQYEWKDRAMEIVPYEVEYINGYLTDEDLLRLSTEKGDEEEGDDYREAPDE